MKINVDADFNSNNLSGVWQGVPRCDGGAFLQPHSMSYDPIPNALIAETLVVEMVYCFAKIDWK